MVFQNYALFPHMSVRQNVGFGLKMRGVSRAETARRVAQAIGLVQLRRPGRQAAGPTLGRPAAARRDRARGRDRAAAGADGRAPVQPRRQAPAGDAGRDPAHPQCARHHHDLRHPRPGRGPVDGRPHRGPARRRRSARSARRRNSTTARPRSTSPNSWASAIASPGASSARRRAWRGSRSATSFSQGVAEGPASPTGRRPSRCSAPTTSRWTPAGARPAGLVETIEYRGRDFVGTAVTDGGARADVPLARGRPVGRPGRADARPRAGSSSFRPAPAAR